MNRSALLRLAIGILISVVFLGATLSQVNLAKVAATITDASPAWLLVAFGIVVVDLGLRALRWQVLLRGIPGAETKAPYNLAVGYLMIGFTLNAILPARLGDIARAILAGNGFRIPRLAVFGTILIERFSDGFTMLALALLSSVIVAAGIPELRQLAIFAIGAGIVGLILLGIFLVIITRPRVRATRLGALVFGLIGRVAVGGGALTTVRGATHGAPPDRRVYHDCGARRVGGVQLGRPRPRPGRDRAVPERHRVVAGDPGRPGRAWDLRVRRDGDRHEPRLLRRAGPRDDPPDAVHHGLSAGPGRARLAVRAAGPTGRHRARRGGTGRGRRERSPRGEHPRGLAGHAGLQQRPLRGRQRRTGVWRSSMRPGSTGKWCWPTTAAPTAPQTPSGRTHG